MSLTFVPLLLLLLALFLGSCQPSIRENPWEHLPQKSVATDATAGFIRKLDW